MPRENPGFLQKLEVEVEDGLTIATGSHPEKELGLSPAQWQFDPLDAQREEIGLRNLLGAVEALEGDAEPGHVPDEE